MHADTPGSGRVAWRRYAVILVPALALAGTTVVMAGQGALAASFAVAGTDYKLSAEKLVGHGFVSYSSADTSADGKHHAVTPAGFHKATLSKLCQSVVSSTPFGDVTMKLEAGKSKDVEATDLVADFDQLTGNITFTGYASGVDASKLSGGPTTGDKGQWGQQADEITITNLHQHTWSTTAATFNLTGLSIQVSFGKDECF